MGAHRFNEQMNDKAEADGFLPNVDLDRVTGGTTFQATWVFRNNGATVWNKNYRFGYTEEKHAETQNFPCSPLGAPTAQTIAAIGAAGAVNPGESVQLTLTFTAPDEPGTYATNWQLQDANGRSFGPVRWLRAVVVAAGETLAYTQSLEFQNSVANFDNMQPGRRFSGTWTLLNTGSKTWTGDFQIAYVDQATDGAVNVARNRMGSPAVNTLRDLTGRNAVKPTETVSARFDLTAPLRPGAYAFHWELRDADGRPFGGVRWMKIGVAGSDMTPPKPPVGDVQFGMNVNINDGHPLDVERMAGLGWVRFVFWASRINQTPEQAYQNRYRRIIQSYADKGIRSLIILHQDTYWGNAPWDNGNWGAYAAPFAEACGRVAKACAEFGDMVAFQIHNEQDSEFGDDAGNVNPSAIKIAPSDYAPILKKATAAIRAAHPTAKIVFGGLKTGPHNAINYVRETRKALGGKLPMDALAYHPYGRFVKFPLFNFGSIGKLGDALDMFKKAFPQHPLWISEVGVAADHHIGSQHYADIAKYIREVVDEVGDNYADYVQALIWFGWTDIMRNAGILTADNKPKPHIFDAFKTMREWNKPKTKSVDPFTAVSQAAFKSTTSTLTNFNAVLAGTEFTSRWTFENTGTTTWNDDFKLVYVGAGQNPAPMTTKTSYSLPEVGDFTALEAGETAVFTLNMTAPTAHGRTYRSQWELRDADDKMFAFLYEEITAVPAPTAGTNVRTSNMAFVADQTIPDFSQMVAGTDFDKQWRVRNNGTRQWGSGFRLVYVEGDLHMARNIAAHVAPSAKPGDTVTLNVPMTTPSALNNQNTTYRSLWRLQDDRGNYFGDPLWVTIIAAPAISTTPMDGGAPMARLLNDPTMWYSQIDPRWKGDKLGHGSEAIGTWGCLMTCMAMALSAHGARINPQELNNNLKNRQSDQGGYEPHSSSVPFLAPFYIGGLSFNKNVQSWPNKPVDWAVWTGENPITRIDQALAKGHIVVAQVDSRLNTAVVDQHWVVIVKRTPDGGDYLMIDPLTPPQQNNIQPRSLMSKYGNSSPSATHETNLRNAIKSHIIYHKSGGAG
ncbi:MAG: cellulase family glycosylhydrolase [Chloroflexi bacterium]|nr:cellulase family glycosylhydrolase [Chloroflexota bacterium]